MHLGPQHLKALALCDPPPSVARTLRIGGTHVYVNTPDLERVGAVEREDSAIPALELRVKAPAETGGSEQHEREGETAAQHSRRLLATTAWKSKRLVSRCRKG